jgi:hypothetical protein
MKAAAAWWTGDRPSGPSPSRAATRLGKKAQFAQVLSDASLQINQPND